MLSFVEVIIIRTDFVRFFVNWWTKKYYTWLTLLHVPLLRIDTSTCTTSSTNVVVLHKAVKRRSCPSISFSVWLSPPPPFHAPPKLARNVQHQYYYLVLVLSTRTCSGVSYHHVILIIVFCPFAIVRIHTTYIRELYYCCIWAYIQ